MSAMSGDPRLKLPVMSENLRLENACHDRGPQAKIACHAPGPQVNTGHQTTSPEKYTHAVAKPPVYVYILEQRDRLATSNRCSYS